MNNKAVLITLATEDFLDQAKQLFSSAFYNAGWKGDYLLLTFEETDDEKLQWFTNRGIIVKKTKPVDSILYFSRHQYVMYAKYSLFTHYFKKWKTILFLDSDIIVKESLEALVRLKGFHAARTYTGSLKMMYFEDTDTAVYDEIKRNYDLGAPSFNAGVMLFSTDIIKPQTYSELIELTYRLRHVVKSSEQAVLNLYFYGQWEELPRIYNFTPTLKVFSKTKLRKILESDSPYMRPIMLHFLGNNTPWRKNNLYYDEWKDNLAKAEKIDLSKRISVKTLSDQEIKKYNKRILKEMSWFECNFFMDRVLQSLAIFIKILTPKLYEKVASWRKKQYC